MILFPLIYLKLSSLLVGDRLTWKRIAYLSVKKHFVVVVSKTKMHLFLNFKMLQFASFSCCLMSWNSSVMVCFHNFSTSSVIY
uniref:Uncharacterized protein n=1 Tax=Arundo donax TaxID=35708 RepID=A0A0A8Z6S1_ARUDO